MNRLSILLLADEHRGHANTLLEHIAAFRRYSAHDVRQFNPRGLTGSKSLDLDEFDVVVIHYSLCIAVDDYCALAFRKKLERFEGLKIQFIQDDYRWVDEIAAVMRDIGIDVLFTLVPTPEIPKVWSDARLPGVVKLNTLAGFVPEDLVGVETRLLESRPIDIGYRGRALPYWIGRLGQEKVWIAKGVLARAEKYGLRCDIGWTENDRIYGKAWYDFIGSCKAILGTESGASITDFDGSIERSVEEYLAGRPTADFEEVYREVLHPFEGNVRMNVVSPRIFEAVALRTPLIMFPGEHSGVVRPWIHYLPLAKDFSNMDEVVEKFRDISLLQAMTVRAYEDVVASNRYSLRAFIRQFDSVVDEYGVRRAKASKLWFQLARLESMVAVPTMSLSRLFGRTTLWRLGKSYLKGFIAVKLTLGDRDLRRVLFRWMKRKEVRKKVPFGGMLKDLLRLGILRQARAGIVPAGARFSVSSRFLPEEGRLEFVSRRVEERALDGVRPIARASNRLGEDCSRLVRSALQEGRLAAMVWNHSAMGGYVPYVLPRSKWLLISMGQHGVHHFEALREFAKRFPEEVGAALLPLLRGGIGEQVEPSILHCLSRSPGSYLAKGYVALKLVLGARELRGVLLRYLGHRELRKEVRVDRVLKDLLRLRLIQMHRARMLLDSLRGHFHIHLQGSRNALVFQSVPVTGAACQDPNHCTASIREEALPETIVWDHSAIGTSIRCPFVGSKRLNISLEPNGVYEFKALVAFAKRYPEETWRALSASEVAIGE